MSLTPQDLLAIDQLMEKREKRLIDYFEKRLQEMATDIYKGVGDVISDNIYAHLDKLDTKFSKLKENLTTTAKAL